MNRKKRINGSGMFLLELIFAILFFAVASSICIRFFAQAHEMSRHAEQLNHAVSECSSAAELINSLESGEDRNSLFLMAYPQCRIEGNSIIICYDAAYSPSDFENAYYNMVISMASAEDGIRAEIDYSSPSGNIYSLSVFRHIPWRAEG